MWGWTVCWDAKVPWRKWITTGTWASSSPLACSLTTSPKLLRLPRSSSNLSHLSGIDIRIMKVHMYFNKVNFKVFTELFEQFMVWKKHSVLSSSFRIFLFTINPSLENSVYFWDLVRYFYIHTTDDFASVYLPPGICGRWCRTCSWSRGLRSRRWNILPNERGSTSGWTSSWRPRRARPTGWDFPYRHTKTQTLKHAWPDIQLLAHSHVFFLVTGVDSGAD